MSGLPPGPERPASEQTLAWFAQPYRFMETCAAEFGDVFTLDLAGTGRHVLCADPASIRQVFAAERGSLRAGEGNAVWLSVMGDRSLLLLDGEEHRQERRLLAPAFAPARLGEAVGVIRAATGRVTARWPLGTPFPMQPSLLDLSLEVILRVVFGLEEGPRLDGLRAAARTFPEAAEFGIAASRPLDHEDLGEHNPWHAFRRTAAQLDELLLAEVAERRATGQRGGDLLSYLLDAGMDDAGLRDELVTMLMAGHETTATSLAWAFTWILRTPGVLERVREDEAYLDATVRESLRICPTIPMISRKVGVPVEVGGHVVPVGANVSPAVYLAHRRPEAWPDPEAFRPERFLERKPSPAEFLPFGGGDRRCPGAELALLEMRVVLGQVLGEFDLSLVDAKPPRPVRRNVTIAPAGGTRVVASRRGCA